jgi:hypothetical protein
MKMLPWKLPTLALAACLLASSSASAAKKATSFGTLEAVDAKAVQAEAEKWLTASVKDAAAKNKFKAIWAAKDRLLMDRVIDTLLLDKNAAKLLTDARNPEAPAPTKVPALLKNKKLSTFYRANLAVAYAKALSTRRVYEEALATLKAVKPEQVADPAAYLFHRAVAEHALLKKDEASKSLGRLLDEVNDVPERYKTVGALMLLDMLTWKEKDLNWVARKMDNSGRRLQLARGGPVTQKIQKDIVNRLDELIKELENKQKGSASGGCPSGAPSGGGGGANAGSPMPDSNIANNTGSGTAIPKKFKKVAQKFIQMPEKERRRLIQEMTRGMSDKHAQAIQTYFKRIAEQAKRTKKSR